MMAASLIGITPVLLVFLFLQKYIVEGLTAGAVKNYNNPVLEDISLISNLLVANYYHKLGIY